MKKSFIFLIGLAGVSLSACSSAPEPRVIYAEPTYNKYGERTGGGCPSGYTADGNMCVPYHNNGCDDYPGGKCPGIPEREDNPNDPGGSEPTLH